jgi:mycoredoxin
MPDGCGAFLVAAPPAADEEDPMTVSGDPAVIMYWRPGCPFCGMLERGLVRHGVRFEKRNIWEDPAHAAVVRSHARGNETVPTVVIGDLGLVNPRAEHVVEVIAGRAAS